MTKDSHTIAKSARARSFGAVAEAYQAHRPGYPDQVIDWALAPLRPRLDHLSLLDLGAGTGKLTAALLRRSAAGVIAVEPDPEMLAVLRATLPGVRALQGQAENIPLPDASVHAVLVGQAFHWFDPVAATAEIVRILRPGGVVALLWNILDQSIGWVHDFYETTGWFDRVGRHREQAGLAAHPRLSPTTRITLDSSVPMTIKGLLDMLGTFSWISTLDATEQNTAIDRARAYLMSRPEMSSGEFELPMRTTVLRVERR
ncbi:MAG: class I SAM-dependent methyltransferase [Pseudonocardia sp.]|nr:class I SAM-dependent methyltransferase [Pseudonocardia sp.]